MAHDACAHLPTGLSSIPGQTGINGTPIKTLQAHEIGTVLGARPGDHTILFAGLRDNPRVPMTERYETGPKGPITPRVSCGQ